MSPPEDANNYPSNAVPVDVERLRRHKSYRVSDRDSFDKLLKDEEFASAQFIQLVEVRFFFKAPYVPSFSRT